jgi:ribosomal 30S subunit maturation factor RimM
MSPDDQLLVGRIARAYGNRGQVIVNPRPIFRGSVLRLAILLIVQAGGASTPRRIVTVRFQQGRAIIALEGIETMTEAEALAGADLDAAVVDAAAAGWNVSPG